MENTEKYLREQFELEIIDWLNSDNENGTYIACKLVEIAKQEFLKLNKPHVSSSVSLKNTKHCKADAKDRCDHDDCTKCSHYY